MTFAALAISIVTLVWTVGWAVWVWRRDQPSITVGLRRDVRVAVNQETSTTIKIDVLNRGGWPEEITDVGLRRVAARPVSTPDSVSGSSSPITTRLRGGRRYR
jgi:hypothetical protein